MQAVADKKGEKRVDDEKRRQDNVGQMRRRGLQLRPRHDCRRETPLDLAGYREDGKEVCCTRLLDGGHGQDRDCGGVDPQLLGRIELEMADVL